MTSPCANIRLGAAAAALTLFAFVAAGAAATQPLVATQRFAFEQWAQKHCPADTVVWVNVRSDIYNSSAERWYGRTSGGAFVCKLEAEKAGYRAKSPL